MATFGDTNRVIVCDEQSLLTMADDEKRSAAAATATGSSAEPTTKTAGTITERRAAGASSSAAAMEALAPEAEQAAATEQSMTLWQAVKTYPHAIGWSVLLSTTLIMEGYDLALLGNLYSSQVFSERYGEWVESAQKYQISAAWQSGLSNGARAGEVFGLIIAGWTADRWGAKRTTVGFLIMMILTIFVLFFAPNVKVLVVGEILCGMYSADTLLAHSLSHSTSHSPTRSRTHIRLPLFHSISFVSLLKSVFHPTAIASPC